MVKTYVFANRKGGVGKSTSASAVFNFLEHAGHKTLLVDLDSQANVSYSYGIDVVANPDILTIADVFAGSASLKDVIQKKSEYGFIVPAHEVLFDYDNGTEKIKTDLKTALNSVAKDFEYCVIDAPPSLGRLTVSALLSGDYLVIPAQADIYSIQGLNSMAKIVKSVQQHNNIKVSGILLTRNNERLLLTKALTDLLEEVAKNLDSKVFKTSIREGVIVREASAQQMGLFDYDTSLKSNVAKDYNNFIHELMGV